MPHLLFMKRLLLRSLSFFIFILIFTFVFVFVFVFVLFFIVLAVFVHLLIALRLVWPRRSTTEPVLGDADTQRRAPTIDSTRPQY
jgi:hypothetical protein